MTSLRDSLTRGIFGLLGLSAALSLSDCADPGGPSFITLGVDVGQPTAEFGIGGSGAPPQKIADVCVRLPVLLGSAVDKQTNMSGFAVRMQANRDDATVTFPGAENADTARTYTLAQLRLGVSENVPLSVNGSIVVATIETSCTNP